MLTATNILGPEGRVAARLKQYEYRPQQLQMAEAVATALSEGQPFDDGLHRAAIRLAQDELLDRLAASGVPFTVTRRSLVRDANLEGVMKL